MALLDAIVGAAGGALAGYLFQRKATIDNTVTELENKTAVALTKLSASLDHIVNELGAIREEMRHERVEMGIRLRDCEKAITMIQAQVQFAPFCRGNGPETPFTVRPDNPYPGPSSGIRNS